MPVWKRVLLGYERFLAALEKFICVILSICILTMVTSVILGVISRNASISLTWINEFSQFSCIWAIYIGLGLGIKYKLLAGVDILSVLIPENWKKLMLTIQNVLILFFLAFFVWSSYPLLNLLYSTGRLSSMMRVPIVYGYLGPVIGSVFAFLFAIDVLIRDLIGREEE